MARYTVTVAGGERRASLLIVLSPSQLCSALRDRVKSRLPDLGLTAAKGAQITLHLNTEDGPMLDVEDLLSDVLPNAEETVYAVVHPHDEQPGPSLPLRLSASDGTTKTLRVRVITPELAQSNSATIPPIPTHVSTKCTLKQLKGLVQEHLGFPAEDGDCSALECNCSLARQIDNNAVLNVNGSGDRDALHTVILVHSNNIVVAIPVDNITLSTIRQATKAYMEHTQNQDLTNKLINFVSGVEDASSRTSGDKRYLKAPVMAICSKKCHSHRQDRERTVDDEEDRVAQRNLVVDVHTSECPLEITAHNADITIEAAGLEDCAVNGILNIYAVQRWTLGRNERTDQGKAGIFKESEAWKHHIGQTDRGLASLLSTLRVFTDLTANSSMDDERRDALIHMIDVLTHFPPAIRAAHILMRGETPCLPERAALAQCLYEVLKNVVPLQTIRSDTQRLFEGSRLLFGLIMEKAKQMKIANENADLPYIGMKVYDLRNLTTMQPVLSQSVQTTSGLVDAGFHEAFAEQGLLCWTNGDSSKRTSTVDRTWDRIAKVSGGTKTQVLVFNSDAARSSSRYMDGGDVNKIISPAEYVDLTYLANLCSRNQLSVTPPASLASASAPVLTLDRNGFLAVYVGRAACAEAGRDILMFRPRSVYEEEEAVDVSIITQLLEPILTQRRADGTIVFEAYGDQHRKLTTPDEITMICVDLSRSMAHRCGFVDIEHSEDAEEELQQQVRSTTDTAPPLPVENPAFDLPEPDELKEYLRSHESYDDFLAIVNTGKDDYHRRQNAEKVLQILQQLHEQQIDSKREELGKLRQQASQQWLRNRSEHIDREINVLSNRSLRLQKYKSLLCAWLIACLGNTLVSDPLTWKPGDIIPNVYKEIQATDQPRFEVPREYCCPISNDVMQNPVITVDNHIYERKEIERWLRTNERSPLTNLILSSNDLRPNIQMQEQITAYLDCSDIVARHVQSPRTRASSRTTRVTLRSPLETHSMHLPFNLTAIELWEIAFRLTKGRYPSYELRHRNAQVPATSEPIETIINAAHEVFITPLERKPSTDSNNVEELCLVKIYRGSSFDDPVVSYWVPKQTTKSVASAAFRYYRQRFMERSMSAVEKPLAFWTCMRDAGDNGWRGTTIHNHWGRISLYLNGASSTGILSNESCVDKLVDDENSESADDEDTTGNRPLVLKLCLRSAGSSSKKRVSLTRLDVVKQMFDAYINRLLAYNFQTHLGLITFSTRPSLSQEITHAVEEFRHKLNNLKASGDTAIWDSIALAQDQLQEYAKQYPTAKLRIICISDGEENRSKNKGYILPASLLRNGIVLDSFCLGKGIDNADLKGISFLTGGYVFQPKSLEEAMAICEMEPVLSLFERPDKSLNGSVHLRNYLTNPGYYSFRMAEYMGKVEHVSRDEFPDRKQHPQLAESFVELGLFNRSSSISRTDSNVRLSRIHNEIRNSGAKPHPHYDIFICESNMGLWKIVMQGPPDSTYSGGTFLLYLEMGDKYPMSPPEARFITSIYHPNINRHGRICHSILDRNWTLDTSTKDVIDTIYSLLLVPEFSDPINTVVTLNYHWDEVQFKEEAQRHIEKHASKSRATWRSEIVG
ncbi:hypothetical protein J4E86_011309 [Alternaria arbusti]|uniref:uncharacterized protein n=1 Tax=Alternaria arbusti TaxID=232088 RepID=UPI00221F47B4|nr:uncharacterized protein J4E86_011309 [Alternaria arbusti]KAI4936692.1 hypothetical protein J4E86_011309 [Alternaria arbusti]